MNWRLQIMALLPKNAVSLWVGWAVRKRWPFNGHTWLRNLLIRIYRINVDEAEKPLSAYPTFGEFFVRRLKPDARPISQVNLVSPVDGLVTQRGVIESTGTLLQAKGIPYSLEAFLGSSELAKHFVGGFFATIYLAPYNYHRIHSPCALKVNGITHVPGALWPVNAWSVAGLPDLFVRNERVLVQGDGPVGGVVVAMVGATNVGRITLDGNSEFHSNQPLSRQKHSLPFPMNWQLEKAQSLGCFEMGSTVILVLGPEWNSRLLPWVLGHENKVIRMGEALVQL